MEGLIFLLIIFIVFFSFRYVLNSEMRIENKITEDASKKRLKVLFIRENRSYDGENPFSSFQLKYRNRSSHVLGIQDKGIYYRIVTVQDEKGEKNIFWVQIETVTFKPVELLWKKIKIEKQMTDIN